MNTGWAAKPLVEVCRIIGGGTPSKSNSAFYDGSIPWATVRDMGSEVLSETQFRITNAAVASSSTNIIPKGNVVIATRVGLGKVCLLAQDTAINQDLRGIIPKDPTRMDARYLFRWFQSIAHHIEREGTGATVKGVKLSFVRSLRMPIPPLPEQKRIVAILDEAFAGIDAAIANTEKNLASARELFESYLNSIFARGGEGWVKTTLGSISKRVSVGHVGPTSQFYCGEAEGVPLIRSQNVRPGKLDFEGIRHVTSEFHATIRKSRLEPGDLLFVRVGANRGDCCSVPDGIGELNCANVIFARPRGAVTAFIEYYCRSAIGRALLLGMTTGSAQGVINTKSVAELPVPTPPVEEQYRIIKMLDGFATESESLEIGYKTKLTALAELKQSLLQKAFAGELTAAEEEGVVAA